ncbi:MAG: hypothetical protein IT326_07305 [Anaerolineae bacterium]|nr:hypothetical protein [Anaerolineae bacterium]
MSRKSHPTRSLSPERLLSLAFIVLLLTALSACGSVPAGTEAAPAAGEAAVAEQAAQTEAAGPPRSVAFPALTVSNTTGADVCELYISLSTSTSWGSSLINAPLTAGAGLAVEDIPAGTYDAMAMDCAGETVDEQFGVSLGDSPAVWEIGNVVYPGGVMAGSTEPQSPPPAPASPPAGGSFSPASNGFSFPNYGGEYPAGNLTIQALWNVYGDAVCASGSGASCVPTPQAQAYMAQLNSDMNGGHCAGFSLLAMRLYTGDENPATLEGGVGSAYGLTQSVPVMQRIAQEFTWQYTEEAYAGTVNGTPAEIIQKLQANGFPADIGIYSDQGGHAVTAYAVEDRGGGIFYIWVYDNNWPGEEKFIEVNVNANTWTYSLAALNPTEDSGPWTGNASTFSLNFIPYQVYQQQPSCSFCAASASSDVRLARPATGGLNYAGTTLMIAARGASVRATNSAGQSTGMVQGQSVNEITGSRVLRVRGLLYNDNEVLIVPNDEQVQVNFEPVTSKPVEDGSVRLISEQFSADVQNLNFGGTPESPAPSPDGQFPDSISVDPEQRSLQINTESPQSPQIAVGFEQNGSYYSSTLVGGELGPGQSLDLSANPETGQMQITGEGLTDSSFGMVMNRINPDGTTDTFATDSLPVASDGSVALDYEAWSGEGPMTIETPEGTEELEDKGVGSVISMLDDPGQGVELMNQIGTYLDPEDAQGALEALQGMGASDEEMGESLGALDGLSQEELAQLGEELGFSSEELNSLLSDDTDGGDAETDGAGADTDGGSDDAGGGDADTDGGSDDTDGGGDDIGGGDTDGGGDSGGSDDAGGGGDDSGGGDDPGGGDE